MLITVRRLSPTSTQSLRNSNDNYEWWMLLVGETKLNQKWSINTDALILGSMSANIWRRCSKAFISRPPQDVDVLAALDFQIPWFRWQTPLLYPKRLLTNHEGRVGKLGCPRRLKERQRGLRRPRTARSARTSTSWGALFISWFVVCLAKARYVTYHMRYWSVVLHHYQTLILYSGIKFYLKNI